MVLILLVVYIIGVVGLLMAGVPFLSAVLWPIALVVLWMVIQAIGSR